MSISKISPLNIAAGYFIVSMVWILLSDTLVFALIPQQYWEVAQNFKGIFFVAVMTIILYSLFTFRDRELRSLNDLKFHSNRILIRSISHHWRQPLSVIISSIDAVQDEIENKNISLDTEGLLHTASKEISDLSNVISNFSEIYMPNRAIDTVSLQDVIESTYILCKPQIENANISFDFKGTNASIHGNKHHLIRLLLNFFSNAIESIISKSNKVNNNGTIAINIEEEKQTIKISISDDGNGIDDEVMKLLFVPYNSSKFPSKNIGISLYWSRWYIYEILGGTLEIKTEKNSGTTVIVELPKNSSKSANRELMEVE